MTAQELAKANADIRWLREQREARIRQEVLNSIERIGLRLAKMPRYYRTDHTGQMHLPLQNA